MNFNPIHMVNMESNVGKGQKEVPESVQQIETAAGAYGKHRRSLEEVKAFNERNKVRIEGESATRMVEGKPETDRRRELSEALKKGKEDLARYWSQARLLFVGFHA